MPIKIPVVFYNGFNYDYYLIIKVLTEEFERQFEHLGENPENYIIFSIRVKIKN